MDYDGTLAPFRVNRNKAYPYPGVAEILKQIIQNGGTRVVLVSGRHLDDLISLVGWKQLPEIWGSHGGERLLLDGTYQEATLPEQAARGLKAAAHCIAEMGWNEHLEKKPFGLAVHWRGMKPEKMEEIMDRVVGHLSNLVEQSGLSLHKFNGGIELRLPKITKGEAVETILGEMQDETVAAYLGDDLTDEDAFAALQGRGLGVLVRDELRETKADLWLRPPEELLNFLKRWEKATP